MPCIKVKRDKAVSYKTNNSINNILWLHLYMYSGRYYITRYSTSDLLSMLCGILHRRKEGPIFKVHMIMTLNKSVSDFIHMSNN